MCATIHFRVAAHVLHVRVQGKDQETNTEAESTDDDEEPGVTSHEVSQVHYPADSWVEETMGRAGLAAGRHACGLLVQEWRPHG